MSGGPETLPPSPRTHSGWIFPDLSIIVYHTCHGRFMHSKFEGVIHWFLILIQHIPTRLVASSCNC